MTFQIRHWTSGVLMLAFWAATASQTLSAETRVRIASDNTSVTVFSGERPILQYRHGDVPFKPYVAQLYTPGGVQILRDSPFDHKHHHALMFAIGADGVDFWSETPKCGHQKGRALGQVKSVVQNGVARASFNQELDWLGPGSDKPVMLEQRAIEVSPLTDGGPVTLLTWRTRLQTPPGKDAVTLTGSHYFGLGMRFVTSMDKGGQFFNAEGKPGIGVRGSELLSAAKWCAYTAAADGKTVTVATFDHPQNARHPARMFTMTVPFAYLSATLNLWKEPLTLAAGKPLALCYGAALWDGKIETADVEKVYQQWVAGTPVEPAK